MTPPSSPGGAPVPGQNGPTRYEVTITEVRPVAHGPGQPIEEICLELMQTRAGAVETAAMLHAFANRICPPRAAQQAVGTALPPHPRRGIARVADPDETQLRARISTKEDVERVA
jgi:hypothetical protein